MIVGFTGSQRDLPPAQFERLYMYLRELARHEALEFHHGDCIGADVAAAKVAQSFGFAIISHPPTNPAKRAYHPSNVVLEPRPYLERNRDIVAACEVLVACPASATERVRSGTWYTIRKARAAGRKLVVIYPDGMVQ